jgi:hypothetical protein
MYAYTAKTNIFYSLTRPKAGKNGKSSLIPFLWKSAGNALFHSVGTVRLELTTSAM